MATNFLRVNMTRGEITPLAHARQDIDAYQAALAELKNFVVLKHGGVRRRSGTRFLGRPRYDTTRTRFLRFEFSTSQAYFIELGHLYMRFWSVQSAGLILSAGLPYTITSPYTEDQIDDVQYVRVNDALYLTHPEVAPQRLLRLAHNNWVLSAVDFVDGPWYPINSTTTTVAFSANPVLGAALTLTWSSVNGVNGGAGLSASDVGRRVRVQVAGVWTICKITTVMTTTTANVLIEDGSVLDAVSYGAVGAVPLSDGTVDLPFTSGAPVHGGTGFVATDVGTALLYIVGVVTKSGVILKVRDENTVNVRQDSSVQSFTLKSATWRLAAFAPAKSATYPRCVAFFEDRLVYANTAEKPASVMMSKSDYPELFTPSERDGTVVDTNGMWMEIPRAGPILWLKEAPRLQVGTDRNIRSIGAADIAQALTPTNRRQQIEVRKGVAGVVPESVGNSTFAIGRTGKRLHDIYYDQAVNSLVAPNMSIMAEHLFKDGVKAMAYQDVPDGVLWMVTPTGKLFAVTHERDEHVTGFHQHDVGGYVESVISAGNTSADDVWISVKRFINGGHVRYIERIEAPFENAAKEDAFFVDCGSTYVGAATNTVTGIDWLEGEIVDVLADGNALGTATVTGGTLTLPHSATAAKITFGKPITSRGTLLRAAINAQDGPLFGRKCKTNGVSVDFYESRGLRIVSDRGMEEEVVKRSPSDLMGQTPPLVTGIRRALDDGSWGGEGAFSFVIDQPLPCTIRGFLVNVTTEP